MAATREHAPVLGTDLARSASYHGVPNQDADETRSVDFYTELL
jgi:hypothetical protein